MLRRSVPSLMLRRGGVGIVGSLGVGRARLRRILVLRRILLLRWRTVVMLLRMALLAAVVIVV
jgi:hypothetical protein